MKNENKNSKERMISTFFLSWFLALIKSEVKL